MKFTQTSLAGSYLIDLDLREDERGFFARYFCEQEFSQLGLNTHWSQANNSFSTEVGTFRGLHLQMPPHAEVKLVRCIQGEIWDVIVDIRIGSSTYGQWFGATLTAANRTMMYVPKGFAHGFITLKQNSEILYLVSESYSPDAELTLLWNDPVVNIRWPIQPIQISDKDQRAQKLSDLTNINMELIG
jgi:dTDP-4-dehydrorhamnose 3,5-epimerase